MKLEEMIHQYRRAARDHAQPGLVGESDLIDLFNEAEQEAAIRGRLLLELSDQAVCEIEVVPGQCSYPLHPALYELSHLGFKRRGGMRRSSVTLLSTGELDRTWPDWRDSTGEPCHAIQTDKDIRLVPTPSHAGVLHLEGYRLPRRSMCKMSDSPEIHHAHHRYLHLWVLHRVYSIPDSEMFDPDRAVLSEREFTRYFGERPDSDLRRITREDTPHTVKPFFV